MSFYDLFPGLEGWVQGLPQVWPVSLLLSNYAIFGAFHLVGLALLGGAVILMNLRFFGAGLGEASMQDLERTLRPWLIVGFAIVFGTGIIIGMLNAEKLYMSTAFFAKMVAMVAALIFSFGVTNAIAAGDGRITGRARIAAAVAILIWLFSMGVFSFTTGLNPGVFHVLTAGYAILVVFSQRLRWIASAIFGVLFGGVALMYFIVGMNNYDQIYLDISKYAVVVGALILAGLLLVELNAQKAVAASPLAKIVALFSVLSWFTVAAAGRWIGFS
jgi:hypothetical protein